MKEYDHFECFEWLGLFYTPNKTIEFPGKLVYTPETGVTLEFMCAFGKVDSTSCLHGELSTGQTCTLIGHFDPSEFGFNLGAFAIYRGKASFDAVIFGTNTLPDDKFIGVTLDLTNFQEFCFPQGFKSNAKFYDQPLFECQTGDLSISIINSAKLDIIDNNIGNLFLSENAEATEKLSSRLSEVLDDFKDEIIFHRKDTSWKFQIETLNGLTYHEAIGNINILENFLSLMMFVASRRRVVSMLVKSSIAQGKFESLPMLTSLFDMSAHKIAVLQRAITHFHQAITPKNVPNFADILRTWFERFGGFETFAPHIANKFGRYHVHELRSALVLLLVQVEGIARYLGSDKEQEKYDLPIRKYDRSYIRKVLCEVLNMTDDARIGKTLSVLRAEVAHVGRRAKLIEKIGITRFLAVIRCLEIIIASHIYEVLTIPPDNIEAFQRKFLPKSFSKEKTTSQNRAQRCCHRVSCAPSTRFKTRANTNIKSDNRFTYLRGASLTPAVSTPPSATMERSARRQTVRATCASAAALDPPGKINSFNGGSVALYSASQASS